MGLLNAVKRLATGKPTKDQIYLIQKAGVETYLHNWNEIDQLCVETAVLFLKEERSDRFWEMWRQARLWVHKLQFELYKLDDPQIVKIREDFERKSALNDTIMLTMLKNNKAGECVDTLIEKYLKQDARQEWFEKKTPELKRDMDEEWEQFKNKLGGRDD